jgi:glutamyl-tRNA(Gln) amidotransferase subunit D
MAKPGQRVIIQHGKKKTEGMLLQSMEKGILLVKLDNGYNIGIKKKGVKVKVVKEKKSRKVRKVRPGKKQKNGLPKITILHTGGTIASQVDYETGGVIARFTPEEILLMFPALREIASIDSRLLRNMWSGDMRFAHYNVMAKAVAAEVKKNVAGVIITHGTDTLGYSAAALSFMLNGIGIPVILVGAQRSSDRGSSDAELNLLCAARFITQGDFHGVAVCMHEKMSDTSCVILPATKTKKLHSSRRDAFKAVNADIIASVTRDGKITWKGKHKKNSGNFRLTLIKENLKIGIQRFHPNMYAQELEAYKNFDGLVLEGTGLGNGPVDVIDKETKEHDKILKTLSVLARKMPVVMTTQTIFGRIQMDVYAYGRKIQAAGVIGNGTDMLTETAFVKLAWLLSNHPHKVREMMIENLHEEISEGTGVNEEFLVK